jgi:hypothetical protein
MSWQFIARYIQNWARQPLWDSGTKRQQSSEISMWCCWKNTDIFVIFCHLDLRFIALIFWHFWTEWQVLCFTTFTVPSYQHNSTFCASQQLLFLLTNTMSHFLLHNSYCPFLPTQWQILFFTTITVPPYQHNVTFCTSQPLLFHPTNEMTCREISMKYF